MKQYDLIVIGTGSAMNIVDAMIQQNPKIRVAVKIRTSQVGYASLAAAFLRKYCSIRRSL